MSKLVAAFAVAVSVIAGHASAVHAGEDFGCGPSAVIYDKRLNAEIESKAPELRTLQATGEGLHKVYAIKDSILAKFPYADHATILTKLDDVMCKMARDPDSGLTTSERSQLENLASDKIDDSDMPRCSTTCGEGRPPNLTLLPTR